MCAYMHTKAYKIVTCNYVYKCIDTYVHTYVSTDNCFTRVLSLTVIVANSRDWLGIIAIGNLSGTVQ